MLGLENKPTQRVEIRAESEQPALFQILLYDHIGDSSQDEFHGLRVSCTCPVNINRALGFVQAQKQLFEVSQCIFNIVALAVVIREILAHRRFPHLIFEKINFVQK